MFVFKSFKCQLILRCVILKYTAVPQKAFGVLFSSLRRSQSKSSATHLILFKQYTRKGQKVYSTCMWFVRICVYVFVCVQAYVLLDYVETFFNKKFYNTEFWYALFLLTWTLENKGQLLL